MTKLAKVDLVGVGLNATDTVIPVRLDIAAVTSFTHSISVEADPLN